MYFSWLRHVDVFLHAPYISSCFQAIALFNASKHREGMMRIQELAAACPNADTLACLVVEVSIVHSMYLSFVCYH